MPGDHEVFSEMPGAHLMFTNEEGTAYMSDLISSGVPGEGFQDAQAEGDEIEEIIEVVDANTGKTIGKRKPRVGTAGKWKALEDECLIESWKAVSLDPITDSDQTPTPKRSMIGPMQGGRRSKKLKRKSWRLRGRGSKSRR
jgi:hypothetical protein